MDQEILTEVPQSMKRLIRLVTRGFYTVEHSIVIDMLVRNPCMKEDDMLELLKFDRKQLRAVINTLKNDKFIKVRMRVETDSEGRTTRHNYYFINYVMFVNVVKYKLDHVRRKIETEERDNTSRASFRCDECQKSFTDLEADQLFDFMTQTFRCTICQNEVIEDESAVNAKDARTLLAKFNEQIQQLYDLLRECEDVKLAPELMEPEPIDIKASSRSRSNKPAQDGDKWSGDATRYKTAFNYTEGSINVTMNEEQRQVKEATKEQPIWMTQSTVDGVPLDTANEVAPDVSGSAKKESGAKTEVNREIENLLMIHEKKSGGVNLPAIPLAGDTAEDSNSSDSDAEPSRPQINHQAEVAEMVSEDEDEEVIMVTVGGCKVPISDVTDDMVTRMTYEEKSEYIRMGQELHHHMYE
ncbi:general transcription factor IIE subunit 1-like isoform X2 [Mya arenaria]|nr:general transcription factor IIE subunit 1-like isoform X2 [Mya arenaria]XP_052810687.1 general transcription factor IIE subunit 1-like isoform X2 [Mya arenaria]XP_052810688.1 general transcription factor IIE subunit 1-like isoform X2 [Mya arenaria]XP_052810689.1 general transcription factor IIE subunit 1-like isoform X2 [Mya arenaria]